MGLQNTADMTQALRAMEKEGIKVDKDDIGFLSPYLISSIKRFGDYKLSLERVPEAWIIRYATAARVREARLAPSDETRTSPRPSRYRLQNPFDAQFPLFFADPDHTFDGKAFAKRRRAPSPLSRSCAADSLPGSPAGPAYRVFPSCPERSNRCPGLSASPAPLADTFCSGARFFVGGASDMHR
ncbi:Tn3 family transposase [Cupriavidus sp. CP313]